MSKDQLKTLINFIGAKASEVVHYEVGLEGSNDAQFKSLKAKQKLYKSFEFDYSED